MKELIKEKWYLFGQWLCKFFCMLFFQWRCYGRENIPAKGAFLLISNHQSFLDPMFCGSIISRHTNFMARDTLFKSPVLGWILKSVGTIPVRRGQADIKAIKSIIAKLKEGRGVCLFPEGTRTRDGRISAFKPGFGLLCRRGNAAVVPVVIEGAYDAWPKHRNFFIPGRQIMVCYGKAIPVEKVKNFTDKELADKITNITRKMQNRCRIKMGKEAFDYSNEKE